MALPRFRLDARVDSDRLAAVRPALERALPGARVRPEGAALRVEAELSGESAKELNRALLSALRREERRTRLRAEWTGPDGTVERYFDYVRKPTPRKPR